MLFPPELVPHVRQAATPNRALMTVTDDELARLLTLIFFASLETEEGQHHPIRVLLSADEDVTHDPESAGLLWTHSWFSRSRPCTARELRRLSRATVPDWTFIQVGCARGELRLLGLARRALASDDDRFLGIVSPTPGRLEVWSRGQRALEYAQGCIMPTPENVILAAGPVHRTLEAAAVRAGVGPLVRPLYLHTIGALVRAMAQHGHGGILAIGSSPDGPAREHGGFDVEPAPALLALMTRITDLDGKSADSAGQATEVLRAALRIGIDGAIAEIGGLTALDGATLLDPTLAPRAFGVILSTAVRPVVMKAADAELGDTTSFLPLEDRGARHRAAAAFAYESPETAVFVASRDGDLACMLRDSSSAHVVMWRCATARGDSA
jgi:hypothetical protein